MYLLAAVVLVTSYFVGSCLALKTWLELALIASTEEVGDGDAADAANAGPVAVNVPFSAWDALTGFFLFFFFLLG